MKLDWIYYSPVRIFSYFWLRWDTPHCEKVHLFQLKILLNHILISYFKRVQTDKLFKKRGNQMSECKVTKISSSKKTGYWVNYYILSWGCPTHGIDQYRPKHLWRVSSCWWIGFIIHQCAYFPTVGYDGTPHTVKKTIYFNYKNITWPSLIV